MMLESVFNNYRKLKENGTFNVLLRPGVLSNYLAFQKEMAAAPIIMTSTPPGVEIELTNRCNLACIQCLRSRGLKPYALGKMTTDRLIILILFLRAPRTYHTRSARAASRLCPSTIRNCSVA